MKRILLAIVFLMIIVSPVFASEVVVDSWDIPLNQVDVYSKNSTAVWNALTNTFSVPETCGHDCRWYDALRWPFPETTDPNVIYRIRIKGCAYQGDSIAPEVAVQIKHKTAPYELWGEKNGMFVGDLVLDIQSSAQDEDAMLYILFAEQAGEYTFESITIEKVDTVASMSIRGDCDGDGRLTPADAACILQVLSGNRP